MHFSAKTPFYLQQSSPYGETHKNSLRFNLHYSSICTLKYISTQCIYSADSTAILKYMYAPTSLALSSKEMPPKKMEMGSLSFIYTYITLCTVQCRQYNKNKYIHGTLRPKIASCVFQQKAAPKNVPPISCKCLQFCVLSVSLDSHLQSGQSCRQPDLKFLLLSLRLHQIKLSV